MTAPRSCMGVTDPSFAFGEKFSSNFARISKHQQLFGQNLLIWAYNLDKSYIIFNYAQHGGDQIAPAPIISYHI